MMPMFGQCGIANGALAEVVSSEEPNSALQCPVEDAGAFCLQPIWAIAIDHRAIFHLGSDRLGKYGRGAARLGLGELLITWNEQYSAPDPVRVVGEPR